MTADTLVKPATNAADEGRNLYRLQAAKVKQQKLRKKQSNSRIREKIVNKGGVKTAGETTLVAAKETARETTREIARETFRETRIKGAKETRKVTSGTGSMVAGITAGETDRGVMDRRDVKNFTRIRMINLFVAKLFEENILAFTFGDYYISCDERNSDEGDRRNMSLLVFYCPERYSD